jgi:glycosyltransferase involved in cell wall biosynthesis
MACGTPVVASNAGSLPETLAEAGRFFDPHNSAEMLAVIKNVLANEHLQQEMKLAGLNRSKQFLWSKASEKLLSIFEEMKK